MSVPAFISGLAMELAALAGLIWINIRRSRYRRCGVPLSTQERAVLDPYFDTALLDSIRVCRMPRIEQGLPPRLLRALRLPGVFDLSFAEGMAFVDAVAVAERTRRENSNSLLFHELIHCVQYRELGTYGFLRRYLRGWSKAGFDSFSIPLEEQAYQLQDRFETGESFKAEEEVRRGLTNRN